MPRLKKELVLERETVAKGLLKTMDVPEANEELAKKYGGMKMAVPRMFELKAEVLKESGMIPAPTKNEPAPIKAEPKEIVVYTPPNPPAAFSPFDDPDVKDQIQAQRDAGVKFPKVYLDC